ncbi:MAG: ATP-binding protein [Deltaproteobacteria bacterium]
MFRTFRAKLLAIVGVAAFAFLILIGVSAVIANQVGEQLGAIQLRFVPRMELGPQLEGQFEQLRRALQDAVGARDGDALEGTRDQYELLVQRLAAAHGVLDREDAALLRGALAEYYQSAFDISRRMIEGETGEGLVDAMSAMQAKQGRCALLLEKVTTFDRAELGRVFDAAGQALQTAGRLRMIVGAACLSFVILLSFWLSRGVLQSLAQLSLGLQRVGQGDFDQAIPVSGDDELAAVARSANLMAHNLKRLHAERDHEDWLKSGLVGLAQELRGELSLAEVGARAARFLARYLEAPAAALYFADARQVLRLAGEYGLAPMDPELAATLSFRVGEGLVGQACLQEQITVIPEPPPNYLRIRSGVGEGTARALAFLPILHLGSVAGVLELGLFRPWSDAQSELLLSIRETLAIALDVARTRASLSEMLVESQRQAGRLRVQEEELQSTNEELHAQQEALWQTNEGLTQQAEELEMQRRVLQEKNGELDQAGQHLLRQADELKKVSTYKSQFLANMSHELRTPLNSMLLLSLLLAENEGKNLTEKQVEFSQTIHSAGEDLLALINQVLDLAKIESGKQDLQIEPVPLARVVADAERVFRPLAREKELAFGIELDEGLPESIRTDVQRLQQILNNLLGNAIKFTQEGQVTLAIRRARSSDLPRRADLALDQTLVFAVSDTGVGIPVEHQQRIFAPFEQLEAASERRFGGTGLGLTIARELAQLLGGSLELSSTPGRGSTFSCYLPCQAAAASASQTAADIFGAATEEPTFRTAPQLTQVVDARAPRAHQQLSGKRVLVVDDDMRTVYALSATLRAKGAEVLVADTGKAALMVLSEERQVDAVLMDIMMPEMDGYEAMRRIRQDIRWLDLPIIALTAKAMKGDRDRCLEVGASDYLPKPIDPERLLALLHARLNGALLGSLEGKTGADA